MPDTSWAFWVDPDSFPVNAGCPCEVSGAPPHQKRGVEILSSGTILIVI